MTKRGLRPSRAARPASAATPRALVFALAAATALALLVGARAASQVTAAPADEGAWSAPAAWPLVAVHLSLTPTGQVLAIDGFGDAPNSERLWDPRTDVFTAVPYGRNLFCSGHIQLADGRTLIVGGHINSYEGLRDTTLFDATARTYQRAADMSVPRWYPTATQLPDGRVLTFAGDSIVQDRPGVPPPFSDASVNSLPSTYDPRTNSWTDHPSARLTTPLYPYLFVLSDGRVLDVGPDTTTRVLDTASWTWSTVAESPFDGHSAVMYRPNKIMKSGAWADPDFRLGLSYASHGRTAVIDLDAATPAWRETTSMAHARSYHNLTLLPDGTVLASGGGTRSDGVDLNNAVKQAEIWNPETETWTSVAPLQNGRLYHSAALLLPDGRVLMAGGGQLPGSGAVNQRNAETYSPPYLFKGPRPVIDTAPSSVEYGETFDVAAPDAARVAKVSLIRSPSVTHAIDMNQRFQFLDFTATDGGLAVEAPADANLAPPGDYLLFLVDTNGVPSVGRFVRIAAASDTSAPAVSITSPGASATLSGTTTVEATASDDVGVAGVRLNVDGATVGAEDATAPFSFAWDTLATTNGTHTLTAVARDAAGNTTTSAPVSITVANGGPGPAPAGLVAAFGFEEGAGTSVVDASGTGNDGVLSGALRTSSGRFGSALSFDGANDWVTIPDASSVDLTSGMTLEAWVRPAALGNTWRTVLLKETPSYYAYGLYASTGTGVPSGNGLVLGADADVRAPAALPANAWTHLATTYDGNVIRLFVNGVQSAQLLAVGSLTTSTGPLRLGGNAIWPEWFSGLIDEVRVYNRALSATEIQTDMSASVVNPDVLPPGAPGTLAASGSISSISLNWGAAVDDQGVVRYNLHRSSSPGFTPSAANRVAQPTGTGYVDAGLPAGAYYYRVTAEDAAGNTGPASNEASAVVTGDTVAPTAPVGLAAVAVGGTASLSWGPASDNVGVARYNVHRSTDAGFTPSLATRIAQPTGTSFADVGLAAGTYHYRVTAEDAAGNVGPPSTAASATVVASPPTGLVAAYSFDQGSGTSLIDHSGSGNHGSVAGATWTTTGRYGGALRFDGSNDVVTIPDSASLDLTTGMTLEAWIKPTALGNVWRTVVLKEQPGNYAYALYGSTGTGRPSVNAIAGGADRDLRGASSPAVGTWTHLAGTYNGSTLTIYLNGVAVGSTSATGPITTSTGALKIGGNAIWPEWFDGEIDEIRIYSRALTPAEIQSDMTTSVGNPDGQAPTAPSGLTAVGGFNSVSLSWSPSADNVGVTRYNVHRSSTPGFTPSAASRIAQPTGLAYIDASLAPGTYYYRVTAEDAAGNISASSNETAGVVSGDTTPPSSPSSLTATGGLSSVSLTWTGSTDDVGVIRYNVHRGSSAGFAPTTANRIAQPTGTSSSDVGLAAGTYYYRVTAEDAAGNLSAASNEATAVVTGDTQPPTTPTGLAGTGSTSSVALTWAGSTDNVGVSRYNVHRSATPGFTASTANRVAQPTGTSHVDLGLAPGTYYYRVTATDAAGNVSGPSNEVAATVTGDVQAPAAPGSVAAIAGPASAALTWNAATDDIGVVRYNVHRSAASGFTPSTGNRVAQPTGTSYTDSPLATGTYYYRITAEDAAGNVGPPSAQAVAVVSAAVPGLVAAWALDETSGLTVPDAAGTNVGTVSGASWVPNGRFGGALSFDGSNDWVTVPDTAALDLTGGMTVEAWVRPSEITSDWSTVVFKEQPGNYAYGLYASTGTTRPSGNAITGGADRDVRGAAPVPVDTWTHLATTYDGANLRVYVDGALAGTRTATGSIAVSNGVLHLGGNLVWGEWFEGLIDEVRIYNRPLTAVEILGDMTRSIGTPDTASPSAPGTLTAGGSVATANLSWGAATDDVGVAVYNVHRSTIAGFIPAAANRVARQATTSYADRGLPAGTYFYRVTAEDAAGNVGAASNEAIATVTTDTSAPTAPTGIAVSTSPGAAALSWTAATDDVAVSRYNVHRSTTSGFVPAAGNRVAQPQGTSYADSPLAAGTYYYRVTAEDSSGNVSPASPQATATITAAAPVGLVAAYGFEEGSGSSTADASGNGNTGVVSGATWTVGRFGSGLSFDGVDDWVTVADSSSLDVSAGMTVEAWVLPRAIPAAWSTVALKERGANYAYGLYASTDSSRPSANVFTGSTDRDVRGSTTLSVDVWSHVAATYDGATVRLYVNGVLSGSSAASGVVPASSGPLRIGGNAIWQEHFRGVIDDVRVYNRGLTQAEVQADMATSASGDTRDPTVVTTSPAGGATNVSIETVATATFSEALTASTVTASTVELRDGAGALVASSVTYDASSTRVTIRPSSALIYGVTYTARIKGGTSGVRDLSGRALASDYVWSFSTEATPPPLAVLTSASNRFTSYVPEILRAEGLSFATLDAALMSPAILSYYQVIVLGEMPLTAAQATTLTDWVGAGGNLIALRPDTKLAGLLGLTPLASTVDDAYLKIECCTQAAAGLVGEPIQYHGTADRYTTSGATTVATLYSSSAAATSSPAVTLRAVGTSGGEAAAFTYDLSRSVVYTRQGNPAWAGDERDGILPVRPDDLFFGGKAGDVRPDWVDTTKLAIPQADEQQRLLVNLIETMNADKMPLPRFWYFPRDERAAIVMTGDDHAEGGTAGRFDRYTALSPIGCSVAAWECVRGTSYIYPSSPLTNAQAVQYSNAGFEVSVHVTPTGSLSCANWTPQSLESRFDTQVGEFTAKYTGIPAPVTHRTHCVTWSDWSTAPKIERAHGMRLDTNYYHYPAAWIGSVPGFMTGSGLPMRFAEPDGTTIDVLQANTNMTDESGQAFPATVDALLDRALGPEGYYGFFVANMHTDFNPSPGSEAIIASALARGVPVISAKQLLDWTEGRDASSFRSFAWSGSTLSFQVTASPGATGLQGMLPTRRGGQTLTGLARNGAAVTYAIETRKGIEYAIFAAVSGTFSATYGTPSGGATETAAGSSSGTTAEVRGRRPRR